jgi:hypothetical protein
VGGAPAVKALYELLRPLTRVPEPFGVGGPHDLWTDPHVQPQMLRYYLDPDIAAASREHAFIERSTAWLVDALDIEPDVRILDLGCGPGLYANPLAATAPASTASTCPRSRSARPGAGPAPSGPPSRSATT